MPSQALPRLVSTSTGEPLPILPPSVALSESLCDLTEGKPPTDRVLTAGSVMDLVARHCLGVPNMAFVGMAREGETTAKGGPWRWPEIVRAIIETWPDDGPWSHWRGLVGVCVEVYAGHIQAPLWALDPAKVRASEEEDGIQAAAAWLSRVAPEPKPTEAPADATTTKAPAVTDEELARLASELRKKRRKNQAKVLELAIGKRELEAEDVAFHVHDLPRKRRPTKSDKESRDKTIRANLDRLNISLEDMGIRVRFHLAGNRVTWEAIPE